MGTYPTNGIEDQGIQNTGTNIGGIQKIEVIKSEYASIGKPDINNNVVFSESEELKEMNFTKETAMLNILHKPVKEGTIYLHTLKWKIPKIHENNEIQITKFINRPVIIRITDNNGIKRIMGNINNPAYLDYDSNIPAETKGWNGYSIVANWKNPTVAPFTA